MTNQTTTRNDIHRPVEMDPASYVFCFADDNQRPGFLIGVDMDWWRSITNWPAATADRGLNQCHHCGARIRYFAILRHDPTGEHIAVGETCLDGRFELESKAQFDRLRKAAELDRKQQRIKNAAREYVTSLLEANDPIANRLGLAMSRDEESKTYTDLSTMLKPGWAVDTFSDIRRKVWDTYGAPTTRQQDLLIRLLAEGAEWQELEATPKAPEAPKAIAPLGRIDFEGKVVFRKWYESDYGSTCKIVVVVTEPDGSEWSVFVTEPRSIETAKGDIIRMRATLKAGKDENSAKGSRPSNAEILVEAGDDTPDSLA